MPTLSDFSAQSLNGEDQDLSQYAGQVVLVVNTASKCGLTPQFEGLEALYGQFKDDGFIVLGFPSNQFKQELSDAQEIGEFCQRNYGVSFPMFATIDVNGRKAHPVFQWLRSESGGALGSAIKWNFTKFLVGRDGHVIERYAPTVEPPEIAEAIRAALAA
ncbi:glutathione peroxidase [Demequina sp.]|uniref:glutathione peroxidase n=1 Tax=Demequina sp. TaxID=2050685 RepID=UPI003A881254